MKTVALHLLAARAPDAPDTHSAAVIHQAAAHDLATPLILVILVAGLIGLAAVVAMFRSATAAISVITQPTMALFRMLVAALIIIVLLVAVLVSRPAEANRDPAPTPTPTPTVTHKPATHAPSTRAQSDA
jgi:hypothetical protein